MAAATAQAKDELSFGPFNLIVNERLLTKGGKPVELGGRALDILTILISTPNEVVRKKDLMARVWPGVTVEDGSLRFHVASLRKALGDGRGGARYITTIAGRGYCFVAPVSRVSRSHPDVLVEVADFPYANLPGRLGRMVGRDDDVLKLSSHLIASRLVTIVGPGGVGKTTVAVAVAHHLAESFAGAVLFVDLGMLSDTKLATPAIASMLGLPIQSDDATPALVAFLKGKRILLVFDTCEHLVETIATLAARLIEAAPQVHILATSREALRIDGEHVYRLDALACAPDAPGLTAEAVRKFPATQLFLERAVASGARLDFSDEEAPVVANICRKLDGVALAIELAARRVESYGLQQTAALLDQHLTLLWQGSRTAPPRQKTLQATLNWSHELLSDLERTVLRQLAVFVGHFTLDAALEVLTNAVLDRSTVFGAIDSLVAKSMVATRPIGAMMRYRLLDTTRAYALDARIDDAESSDLAARHAFYYQRWLEQTGIEWATLSTGAERAPHFASLNNVRAALEWCFGETGAVRIGVGLAAAAAPVFLAMSLLPECHRWSARALLALDEGSRGGREEMQLQAGLGISLMFTRGNSEPAHIALNRSLAIAEEHSDVPNIAGLLGMLHMYHLRGGDFRTALQHAEHSAKVAESLGDAGMMVLAHALSGISRHLMGDLDGALVDLEKAVEPQSVTGRLIYFGFDYHSWASAALATTLWLRGYPAQASTCAHRAIADAERIDHPVSLAIVLAGITVLLSTDEMQAAEQHLDWFISRAGTQSFGPYFDVGQGLKGELAIRCGDFDVGLSILRDCLDRLHAAHYERFTTRFHLMIARGLAGSGRYAEAMTLIDETIRMVGSSGGTTYSPELLRLKGSFLLAMPMPRIEDAEACFRQSLELSRRQGARAWELRTATDLAALWTKQGRADDAQALLRPVFAQFTEGSGTVDFKAAEQLLATLG